jgi:hypothetical protein
MGGKQMEGDNRQRRKEAAASREAGKAASETGSSLGSTQQRTEAGDGMSHQERLDLKREGKPEVIRQRPQEARPGSREAETVDRERHPRR